MKILTASSEWQHFKDETGDFVLDLVKYCIGLNATDIHMDPIVNNLCIRIRVDGLIKFLVSIDLRHCDELLARLKILSGTRIDIHHMPQDGSFRLDHDNALYNIRVSFMPTLHGENAVMRLLKQRNLTRQTLESVGFSQDQSDVIRQIMRSNSGLILVVGPTGSGKTTTLKILLEMKTSEPLSVLALEDPVEYEIDGVRHIPVSRERGTSFANYLRSSLRQDPDVIMLGEIRDLDTAKTAISTALTGHLVLSTLHTNSAIETVLRLEEMGVDRYLIAATLRLVICQRLVRVLCESCKGLDQEIKKGCSLCSGSGYSGRTLIAEILPINNELKDQIVSDIRNLKNIGMEGVGLRSIFDHAREKVMSDITSELEIRRVISN